MAASRKGHDKGSVKSHTDHTQVEEYDEVLNKYHQKSNAKVTKKRFLELQNVCCRKLEECEVIDFTRNLDECLKVCIDLHSKHSAVDASS
jgi:hypothetical protein